MKIMEQRTGVGEVFGYGFLCGIEDLERPYDSNFIPFTDLFCIDRIGLDQQFS